MADISNRMSVQHRNNYNACLLTHSAKKKIVILHSSSFLLLILLLSSVDIARYCPSYLLTLVYIHINPLHFLAHSAVHVHTNVFYRLFSNNDIKTPDQVSVPCTTPYFSKDTLTPPSSRSLPLEGGGPSTCAARDASL